ncbi:hypothetical protein NEMIN01_1258 [Nematocida minor]|uniref:uncharacterized protein n=1 Tax=Nematocida minor TaxID=1912983 RepID=UPI00221E736A|nr:uncharacterized protein NEMIN01_1258 [Nematocida minor]KAI5190856.1 hypothetical protein NEMIN01_1258 [Nematocida minor]
MLIMGDMDRVKIYTLSELEKKEKLEMVLANEFDIFSMTGVDPKDKEFQKTCIKEVMRQNPSGYNHKCNCPVQKFKQVKYIPAKDVIAYNSGKCSLDVAQIGYLVPRNSAFGKEFRGLLLLVRQIIISKKETISVPFEFFTTWLGLNVCIVCLLYMEKYIF